MTLMTERPDPRNAQPWLTSVANSTRVLWYLKAYPGTLLGELDALCDGPATDGARVRIVEIMAMLNGSLHDVLDRIDARKSGRLQEPSHITAGLG